MLRDCPTLAFVDVETTGGSPRSARVTEVGIVLVRWPADNIGPPHLSQWSSLVNPGVSIPEQIRFLTGITNEMVNDAPGFAQLAPRILDMLDGAIFVAHNARFDYGFIKTELARCGHSLTAKTLCTVRLSRMLHPDRSPHSLDAIISRHKLSCPNRHRALGDALVLWQFLIRMFRDHGIEVVDEAAGKLLKRPNLPSHLGIESVDNIPARPGIYFFHGLNTIPLYIGKSRNIRQRIASHFCNDHHSERGLRLSRETRRISWQETPGEFTALLAEIQAIEQFMPAHNKALRRNSQAVAVRFTDNKPQPEFLRLPGGPPPTKRSAMLVCEDPGSGEFYGPFKSRAVARTRLQKMATEHHWCQDNMGLTRGAVAGKPCFARQLNRCTGACVNAITDADLHRDVLSQLESTRIPAWPEAQLLVVERGDQQQAWHLFDHWCWLASGTGEPTHDALTADKTRLFDSNIYTLLRKNFGTLAADDAIPPTAGSTQDVIGLTGDSTQSLTATWIQSAASPHQSDENRLRDRDYVTGLNRQETACTTSP